MANENNLKSCKAHNIAIEEHFIANELNKFRQQLQKVHKKNYVKKRLEQTLKMDNTDLMKSLEKSSKHIEDFYAAPVEALHQVYDVCRQEVSLKESDKENLVDKDHNNEEDIINKTIVKYEEIMQHFPEMNENEKHICRTPSPLTETEELLKPMKAVGENHMLQIRCVRFEEEVEVCKFQRENSTCSNTSDGIDSVISDLAEEALYELKMEEEAKSKQQESLNNVEPIKETTENPTSDHSVTSVLTTATTTSNEESSDYMTPLVIKGTIAPSTFKNSLGQEGIEHISNSEDDESTLSCEQNKIIEQLFQARAHTNIYILRKYFLKWIHFTTIQKIERESDSRNDRVHLINVFLDKIRKEKVRLQKSKSRTGESTEENSETNGLQSHREKPKGLPIQAAKKYQNK